MHCGAKYRKGKFDMKSFNEYLTRYQLHEEDAEAIINAVSEYLQAKTAEVREHNDSHDSNLLHRLENAAYEVAEILDDLHPMKYQVMYEAEYLSSNCDNFEFFASFQEAEDFVNDLPSYYVYKITEIS